MPFELDATYNKIHLFLEIDPEKQEFVNFWKPTYPVRMGQRLLPCAPSLATAITQTPRIGFERTASRLSLFCSGTRQMQIMRSGKECDPSHCLCRINTGLFFEAARFDIALPPGR